MDYSLRAPETIQSINKLEKSWSLFADKKSVGTLYWDTKQNSFTTTNAISSFFRNTIGSKGPSSLDLELPSAFHAAITATQESLALLRGNIPSDPTAVKSCRVALENLKITLLTSIYGTGGYQYVMDKLQGATSEQAVLGRQILPLEKETLEKTVLPQLDLLIASLLEEPDELLDSTFNTLSLPSSSNDPQKQVVREMIHGIKNNITPIPLESEKGLFIPTQSKKDFERSSGYRLNNELIHENTFPDWESSYKEYVDTFQKMYGETKGAQIAFQVMSLTNQSLLTDLLQTAVAKTGFTPLSGSFYYSVTITPEKISIEMRTIIPFHEIEGVIPVKRVITFNVADLATENSSLPSLAVIDTWLPLFKNLAVAKEILHKF